MAAPPLANSLPLLPCREKRNTCINRHLSPSSHAQVAISYSIYNISNPLSHAWMYISNPLNHAWKLIPFLAHSGQAFQTTCTFGIHTCSCTHEYMYMCSNEPFRGRQRKLAKQCVCVYTRGIECQLTGCLVGLALANEVVVLVTKEVVADVVLLGALWSQHKRLDKRSHWLSCSRQLPGHL